MKIKKKPQQIFFLFKNVLNISYRKYDSIQISRLKCTFKKKITLNRAKKTSTLKQKKYIKHILEVFEI